MSFTKINALPTPDEIKETLPLSVEAASSKLQLDTELKEIFTGESSKFLMIIGPCSAHDSDAVMAYVDKLAKIQEKVKDSILLLPRIYTNKPRTTGIGYKGMLHQPDPNAKPDMAEGIKAIRRLHLKVLSETGLGIADEMLYPENFSYLSDILSYVAVGARSVENQQHRLTVSGLDIPAGMKNPTSGNLNIMLNSVQAAQVDHIFSYNGSEMETSGNHLAHTILRGGEDHYGRNFANYHYEDIHQLVDLYGKRDLQNPATIIDCNHANSAKKFNEQPRILNEILNNRQYSGEFASIVKGVMVESFLVEGNQPTDGTTFGQSITDACIGWDTTEKLILSAAEQL